MIKILLLDVDNTLLSFDASVKQAMKKGFETFGLGEYEEGMFLEFSRINNSLWKQIEEGTLDFPTLLEIRWNTVFRALGISFDGVLFETYFRDFLFQSAIPEKGAKEGILYLEKKYTLCAATNGPYHQQINRLKLCGFHSSFSHFFISEEMGCSKPSPEFFSLCFSRLKESFPSLLPEEILMLGDSLSSDIEGGTNFGMKTCLYHPDGKTLPPAPVPDYSFSSWEEIGTIL